MRCESLLRVYIFLGCEQLARICNIGFSFKVSDLDRGLDLICRIFLTTLNVLCLVKLKLKDCRIVNHANTQSFRAPFKVYVCLPRNQHSVGLKDIGPTAAFTSKFILAPYWKTSIRVEETTHWGMPFDFQPRCLFQSTACHVINNLITKSIT